MQKIFVTEQNWNQEKNTINITGEEVNHIKNVLRYKIDETIEIKVTGNNEELLPNFLCKIESINKDEIVCKIVEEINVNTESNVYLNIVQGIPKFDKMELIIEKATELGAKEITPIKMKRCISKIDNKEEEKKISRWQKIAESAAKQSKRDIIPIINKVYNIDNIFELLKEYDIVIVAYEDEKVHNLKEKLKAIKNKKHIKIAVIIGPEGGIEKEEIDKLKNCGAEIVSLGKRILRTETVSIAVASVIMYELGDFCS